MKVKVYFFLLICLSVFFVSCSNFLDGSSLRAQLEEEVSFHNGNNASVKFTVPAGSGSIEPTGSFVYRVGASEEISFTPISNYTFSGWSAYDENGNLVGEDVIQFKSPESAQTKVVFLSRCNNVTIKPIAYLSQAPIYYNAEDYSAAVRITDGRGIDIPFEWYSSMGNEGKKYESIDVYKETFTKNINITVNISSLNSYKRLYIAYENGDLLTEKLLSKDKATDPYNISFSLESKNIKPELIKIYLEDFYGKSVQIKDESSKPVSFCKSSTIKEEKKINLSVIEPYKYKITYGNAKEEKLCLESDNIFLTNDIGMKTFTTVYSVLPEYDPENDFAGYDSNTQKFLENLKLEVYGGTSQENLSLLSDVLSADFKTITLPKNKIDTSRDYFFKTVIKAVNGEEYSALWTIKPDAIISKLIYDTNYYIKVKIPDGLYGKKWDLYNKNSKLRTYTLNDKETIIPLGTPKSGDSFKIKLDADGYFCESNEHEVSLTAPSDGNANGGLVERLIVRQGSTGSGKYKAKMQLKNETVAQKQYIKYIVSINKKIIAELSNENLSFEIPCDDLFIVPSYKIKIYAVTEDEKTDFYTIEYTNIEFLLDNGSTTNAETAIIFRNLVKDITSPDLSGATFTADSEYLTITLQSECDSLSSQKDKTSQKLKGDAYFVPFEETWEGLSLNEIPVSDQKCESSRNLNVNYYPVDCTVSSYKFTIKLKRWDIEKYNKAVIFLNLSDGHGNYSHAPVFIYETDNSIVDGMEISQYMGEISVKKTGALLGDYFVRIPKLSINEKITKRVNGQGTYIDYASSSDLTSGAYSQVEVSYASITGNSGIFATTPDMFIWYTSKTSYSYDYLRFETGRILFYLNDDSKALVRVMRSPTDYGDSLDAWEKNVPESEISESQVVGNMDGFTPNFSKTRPAGPYYFNNGDYYIVAVYWPDQKSTILKHGRYFK